MPTFRQQQERVYHTRYKLAVWQHLYDYIDENYVAKDHSPPQMAIKEHNAIPDIVPEETYDHVLEHIGDQIGVLREQLSGLENQEVVVLDEESEEVPRVEQQYEQKED